MEEITRKKRAKQRHLTRAAVQLQNICESSLPNLIELKDVLFDFDIQLSELDKIQEKLEENLPEENLIALIDEYVDFREGMKRKRSEAKVLLEKQTYERENSDGVNIARLPKISLPYFSGDVMEWFPFWDQFKVLVHETEIPAVTKFTYLVSILRNEAKACIQGLSLTETNYETAIKILKDRFGRKEKIIASHIDTLLRIDVPSNLKTEELWRSLNTITINVRSLENLGIDGKQYGVIITPIILSKIPKELRLEWARESGHEGDLQYLLEFLAKEIARRERSKTDIGEETRSHKMSAATLHNASRTEIFCKFCKREGHHISVCRDILKYDVDERIEKLRERKICFRCLSRQGTHDFRKCESTCHKCKGTHHAIICRLKNQNEDVTQNKNN